MHGEIKLAIPFFYCSNSIHLHNTGQSAHLSAWAAYFFHLQLQGDLSGPVSLGIRMECRLQGGCGQPLPIWNTLLSRNVCYEKLKLLVMLLWKCGKSKLASVHFTPKSVTCLAALSQTKNDFITCNQPPRASPVESDSLAGNLNDFDESYTDKSGWKA